MNDDTPGLDGRHGPTGFTGRTINSLRAEVRQGGGISGSMRSAVNVLGPASNGYSSSSGPVSEQFLRAQHQQQVRAEVAGWHDHATGTARVVQGVSAESNPAAFLAKHGIKAVNSLGEEVVPTAAQARGLVGRLVDATIMRSASSRGGTTSVSFTDNALPPNRATVHARRVV